MTQRKPTHPGAILREDIIPDMQMSVTQFARDIHVSRQLLHGILSEEKPVSPATALKLHRYLGNDPEFWLNMQQSHDLWNIQEELKGELRRIKPFEAA